MSKKRRSEPDIASPSKMDFERHPLKQRRASSVTALGGAMQEITLTPNLPAEFHATNMQGSMRAPAARHLAGQTWEPETPMVFVRDRESRDMHPLQAQTDGNRWYFRPPPAASSAMYWVPIAPANHTMPSTSHPTGEPAAASQWSTSAAPTAPADQDRRLLERVDALVQQDVDGLHELASDL